MKFKTKSKDSSISLSELLNFHDPLVLYNTANVNTPMRCCVMDPRQCRSCMAFAQVIAAKT